MRASLVRRYLVFLLIISIAVVGGEQLYQLVFLNTRGQAEAEHALRLHPDLAERIGAHHFGVAWRGHRDWWTSGGGPAIIYMPVTGERTSGVLYLREADWAGVLSPQKTSFRENGSIIWTSY